MSRRRLKELFRRGRISLVIGLTFLAAAVGASELIEARLHPSGFITIPRESVVIGGWVAMWRPIEVFLYDWWPIRAEARLYDRLAAMPVRIQYQARSRRTHAHPDRARCQNRLGMFAGAGRILIKQVYLLHAREERADMAVTIESRYSRSIHPLHAVSLAGTVPLFLGAALSDAKYASTYEIQWSNFASWLIVGGLVFGGIALLFAIIDLSRPSRRAPGVAVYLGVLLATWVVGFFNALMHARDAWGSMPGGLILSVVAALLACSATWFGFATPRIRGLR